jgi:hypothetical protein
MPEKQVGRSVDGADIGYTHGWLSLLGCFWELTKPNTATVVIV